MGWEVARRMTPSGAESVAPEVGGISADHGYLFVHAGPLHNEGASSYGSLYQGSDADYLGDPTGHFELTGIGSQGVEKFAEGRYISPGGEHVIFSTGSQPSQSAWCYLALFQTRPCPILQLEPNAAPSGTGAIYDRAADGPTRVVSLLPEDEPAEAGEDAFYQGASKDGTIVAFKINGVLYVRVANATTKTVTEAASTYGGMSDSGHFVFYVVGGNIHRFDVEAETDLEVNSTGDAKMVHISGDGSHVYFISESQLVEGKGTAGQPNLYVWSGGAVRYIATVAADDVPRLGNWTTVVSPSYSAAGSTPGANQSRATEDGKAFIFVSRAPIGSFDNAGHFEVYRYEERGGALTCVSCNPLVDVATADSRLQDLAVSGLGLPNSVTNSVDVLHNLSEDGSRIFFETSEALSEADTDGVNDIYEWHQLIGEGAAQISLITSGQSTPYEEFDGYQDPNVLMAITPDGSDVFFRSTDALVEEPVLEAPKRSMTRA
jgi:hypothetical protein